MWGENSVFYTVYRQGNWPVAEFKGRQNSMCQDHIHAELQEIPNPEECTLIRDNVSWDNEEEINLKEYLDRRWEKQKAQQEFLAQRALAKKHGKSASDIYHRNY